MGRAQKVSLLNRLPWRRKKIEAVRLALDPYDRYNTRSKLGPLSSESLEVLLVAIAGLQDERGLRVHIDPREVLRTEFIEQNFVPVHSSNNNFHALKGALAPRNQAVAWPQQKKTRP